VGFGLVGFGLVGFGLVGFGLVGFGLVDYGLVGYGLGDFEQKYMYFAYTCIFRFFFFSYKISLTDWHSFSSQNDIDGSCRHVTADDLKFSNL
jgi:hypothetical protein